MESFDNILKMYESALSNYGYTWVSRGNREEKGLFVRVRADFKRDIVGVGETWQECLNHIIKQIKE